MKKITLYMCLCDESDILLEEMQRFCEKNDYNLEAFKENLKKPRMVIENTKFSSQEKFGKLKKTLSGYKKNLPIYFR